MVSPRSSIRDDASVHSSIEQQSAALEASALQPLGVAFLQDASEAAGVSLEERVTPLGPLSKPLPEGCEMCVAPPVEQPTTSEVKGALPLFLLGEACHHLGLEKLKGKTSQNSHVGGKSDEKRMQNLLIEAEGKGITIFKDIEGVHIKMGWCSKEEEQWECLRKIHDFMPIAHLKCERSENVEALLLFLQSNEGLVYLDLGISPNMTDEQLERISQHLPALKSFSINSAQFTCIPKAICSQIETLHCVACKDLVSINAPLATTIGCSRCTALTTLDALFATTIDCWGCAALTTLNAPIATTIECSRCTALTTLDALFATTIDCWGCVALTTLNAPIATTIECVRCTALTTLSAPFATTVLCTGCEALTTLNALAATTVQCNGCESLTTLNALAAKAVQCNGCTALTTLNVPVARTVQSNGCIVLTTLNAPEATAVLCSNCTALTTLDAPAATTIRCISCTALTTLKAPLATTVQCNGCTALMTLNLPAAVRVSCNGCKALVSLAALAATSIEGWQDTALSGEARLKVLTRLRKNIIIGVCYAEENQDVDELMKQVGETQDRPLNRWLTEARRFVLPANFESKSEENDSKQKIDGFLEALVALAEAEGTVKEGSLKWFATLKKLDSLQQQMKRVIWLGAFLMCTDSSKNLFADPAAFSTLTAIGNLENPFLQQQLTRALLSIYDEEASKQLQMWKTRLNSDSRLEPKLKRYQILPHLLLSRVTLKEVSTESLLQTLEPTHYKNTAVLTPILEMVCMLSSLSSARREKLLTLILKAPQRDDREGKIKFRARVTAHRKEQSKWVKACRDLLFFAKFDALGNVKNEGDLLEKHKTICEEIFGVREEFVHEFNDAFTSKRYSNALLTYAARLQTLAQDQKSLLTQLLGKFVNGHLEGRFPACRYDLSINPHLATIFNDNQDLLKKWMLPLEIDLTQSERQQQGSFSDPCDMVKRLMAEAIDHGHLGDDSKTRYPTLKRFLGDESAETLSESLIQLKDEFDRLKTTGSAENKQKHLAIEMDCLKALDPSATSRGRMDILNSLLEKLPEGLQFKHDVVGILKALQPRKVDLQKIESTDSWEDLILMGTEVSNSCQHIDGNPNTTKCLLAYILDGKNKAIVVRDVEGKIAARSVLRLLWNKKQKSPVLFMEHVYTRTGDRDLAAFIKRGCMQKAEEMGLPLVASARDAPQDLPYEGVLSALGGPAPFEYVDALYGIQKDGEFEIPESKLLYAP